MMALRRLLAVSVALLALGASARADNKMLTKAEAFLLLGHSGKLSANILPPSQAIGFWNVSTGEGAGEPAEDVLVVLHFKRLSDSLDWQPAIFRVTDEFGKTLFEREDFDVWFDKNQQGAKAFMLERMTCRHIKLSVTAGTQVSTFELPFECGD